MTFPTFLTFLHYLLSIIVEYLDFEICMLIYVPYVKHCLIPCLLSVRNITLSAEIICSGLTFYLCFPCLY